MRLVLTFYSPSLRRSKRDKRQSIVQLSMVLPLKVKSKKLEFYRVKLRNTRRSQAEEPSCTLFNFLILMGSDMRDLSTDARSSYKVSPDWRPPLKQKNKQQK